MNAVFGMMGVALTSIVDSVVGTNPVTLMEGVQWNANQPVVLRIPMSVDYGKMVAGGI